MRTKVAHGAVVATDGHDHWRPRHRVGDQSAAQAEDFFDQRFGDHLGGRTVRNNAAGTHRDQVVAVAGRVIQVVEHEHDRSLLALVEIDEQIEHFYLVGKVEKRLMKWQPRAGETEKL